MNTLWRLKESSSGRLLVPRLQVANSFWSRLVGLQFRKQLPLDAGLLLAPCNGIHTCFVRFPIDATFLDQEGKVLQIRRSVKPWRIIPPVSGARAVLETSSGSVTWTAGEGVCLESHGKPSKPLSGLLGSWHSGR